MIGMKKYKITRATVVLDNMPAKNYDVKEIIDKDGMDAYKESIKIRYARESGRMDVDVVYKEIDE